MPHNIILLTPMRRAVAIALALIWGSASTSACPVNDEPTMALRFDEFLTTNIYKGKVASPRLDTPAAKNYRTALKRGVTRGPNFAGDQIIVEHGCGACAKCFLIVNARTGRVYEPEFGLSCHFKENVIGYARVGLDYKLESDLLVATGARNEKGGGEYYYLWKNDRLTLVKALEDPCK